MSTSTTSDNDTIEKTASFTQGDYDIEAEITDMGRQEEARVSARARVELRKDGEKKLTVIEKVDSGNQIPGEPDMEDKIRQTTEIWQPEDQRSCSKIVSAGFTNDEVAEMDNEEFAEQVIDWIENCWDYEAVFEYEEIQEEEE
ncbi:MAG: hypothetical protein ABEJ72_03115 [Candidatus Aenigmatarchaeota archaeon]